MSRRVTLKGRIQEMSEGAIQHLLPHDLVMGIRAVDAHPYFAQLVIGHEGESNGKMILRGAKRDTRKLWNADVVKQIADRALGANVFIGHPTGDGSGETREVEGKVIHGFHKSGGNRPTEAHAIAYIKNPETRKAITEGTLDVCSIEADLIIEEDEGQKGGYIVRSVEALDGVALGSRDNGESPGFGGAGILAAVEMLATKGADEMSEVTKADVLDFIRTNRLKPTDIFSPADVSAAAEPTFKERLSAELEKVNAEAAGKLQKAEAEVSDLKKVVAGYAAKAKAEPLIEGLLKGRKLSVAQAAAITRHVMSAVPADFSGDEKELTSFLETQVKTQLDYLGEMGVKIEAEAVPDNGQTTGDAAGGQTTTPPPTSPKSSGGDLTDPANNDFIPKG